MIIVLLLLLLLASHVTNQPLVGILSNDAHQIALLGHGGGVCCKRVLLLYFDRNDCAIDVSLVTDAQDHDVSFLYVKNVSVELILGCLLVHR